MPRLPPTLTWMALSLVGCGAPAAEASPEVIDGGTALVDGGAADGGGHDAAPATGLPDVRALPAPVPPCAVLTLPTGVERVCPMEAAAADAVPLRDCVPGDAGPCDALAGRYLPVVDGPRRRVWAPSDGRYLNEATLTRGPDAQWHVFSNAGPGPGSPWVEDALLHGTAPTLAGPWTLLPDAVHGGTPGAVDRQFWAPFVMPVEGGWRLAWMGQRGGGAEPGQAAYGAVEQPPRLGARGGLLGGRARLDGAASARRNLAALRHRGGVSRRRPARRGRLLLVPRRRTMDRRTPGARTPASLPPRLLGLLRVALRAAPRRVLVPLRDVHRLGPRDLRADRRAAQRQPPALRVAARGDPALRTGRSFTSKGGAWC
jgi:hypothetical protein